MVGAFLKVTVYLGDLWPDVAWLLSFNWRYMHCSLVVVVVRAFFSQGLCSCPALSTHQSILDFFPETFNVTCLFKAGTEAVVPLGFSCLSRLQIDILLGHFREQSHALFHQGPHFLSLLHAVISFP